MDPLAKQLSQYFGYDSFREGQRPIIEDVLKGEDVLGILPTGTGKSLTYQLPSLLQEGMTIVVSPLISLMIDQVKQLKAQGFKSVVAMNSFINYQERKRIMTNITQYKLLYISPEMLQNEWVLDQLTQIKVDLFVIDEAHCISQWGHEFRTDYLKLHVVLEQLRHPTVLALSATATPEVQDDILKKLKREGMKKRIYSMDKQNISFAVKELRSPEDKLVQITQLLQRTRVPAMIYFSSRQWAERAAVELQSKINQRVAFYHGGMEQTDRMLVQQQFMNDQLDVICCTSAFGMGVDKQNIRLVIHFHLPSQLESFIQEVGRAGRDGNPCVSLLLFSPKDHYLPQLLIEGELPDPNEISTILQKVDQYANNQGKLPDVEHILEELQLSESQWNFIHYQLEERGVFNGQSILQNADNTSLKTQLTKVVQQRWKYKQSKLTEMIHWIHSTTCRRTALYEPFQNHIRPPKVPCCDMCSFDIDQLDWQEGMSVIEEVSWQERLANVFAGGQKK
ncbi:RecQ family ATP-dependent DNA helicase [Halobacillus salinus]|uniref:ATP-dependent DNA helicase RecQ n=1 Tax=Halobacillus salinus TaxID=192814 RepID=A0A4Z0H5T0_9BACI|nr:ATP-dependent DNA helicase RecQ [Halobacillus salinus]TGB04495.1 ATP-dependent DNA helicase RecQ [Halobacillus salinus]